MYIKNSYITYGYRLTFLILCGGNLLLHFSFDDMEANSRMFAYFTVESQILSFVAFLFSAKSARDEIRYHSVPYFRYSHSGLRGIAVLAMLITFISYQYMLKSTGFTMYSYGNTLSFVKDLISHFILPLMVVGDWLLFQPKGLYRWFDTLLWLLFPFCYLILILLRGFFTQKYPYFFLNVEEIGFLKVCIFVCIYLTCILIIGFVFFLIDKALSWIAARLEMHRQ